MAQEGRIVEESQDEARVLQAKAAEREPRGQKDARGWSAARA
jgi:hypothetical protein